MQLAVSTSQNHTMLRRRKNVWYSVKDGNWEDPNIWMSNALDKKSYVCPQYGDEVHIMHIVDYANNFISGSWNPANVTAVSVYNYVIGNLFIHQTGKLTATRLANQNNLIVSGNLQCDGTIDFATGNLSPIVLWIKGVNNWVNNWSAGTQSTIFYYGAGDFSIMPLTYYNLEIGNIGTKTLTTDLVVNGTLTIDGVLLGVSNSVLELGAFNYTGNITIVNGKLSKTSGTGIVTFNGNVGFNTGGSVGGGVVSFTGNPVINMYGGLTGDTRNGVNFGSNTLNVLANQSWSFSTASNNPSSIGSNSVLIASGKTLTLTPITGNLGGWINKGSINGIDSTSVLNVDGTYGYGTSSTPMTTGVFNYNHSGASKIYVDAGVTMTLQQTSFYDLASQGIITLMGNTTISRNLNIDAGSMQLSTYDFSVSGATSLSGALNKSGSGNVSLNSIQLFGSLSSIGFTGNPTVNLSGNLTGDCRGGINFGANPVNISTSLTFSTWTAGNVAIIWANSFLIASGKTFTSIGLSSTLGGITTTGTINGVDGSSIFDNRSNYTHNNSSAPMSTGKLYCNQAPNTFIYGLTGNQDITAPADTMPGYQNLTLQGSGAKRLLGNVSVKGLYTLSSPATLNTNGFALTNP
jgi:hypothetical protein